MSIVNLNYLRPLPARLATDPYAQAGAASYDVIEFHPVKQHRALAATGLLDAQPA